MYKEGSIVLVPFPFTDLSGNKVRPALILSSKKNGDDITVCFISSQISKTRNLYEIKIAMKDSIDFKKTGLKSDSIIKVVKIATLDKKVILGELGLLNLRNMKTVKSILKEFFDL